MGGVVVGRRKAVLLKGHSATGLWLPLGDVETAFLDMTLREITFNFYGMSPTLKIPNEFLKIVIFHHYHEHVCGGQRSTFGRRVFPPILGSGDQI